MKPHIDLIRQHNVMWPGGNAGTIHNAIYGTTWTTAWGEIMNEITTIPSVEALKAQAKRLRSKLADDGQISGHGQALEILARQMGYRDWNTLHAAAGNRRNDNPLFIGERVSGHYLGQHFVGEVIGLARQGAGDRMRVTIHFDEPVDVVTFDSFSAFRQRVSCTLNKDFTTTEKTSNGLPHMRLER